MSESKWKQVVGKKISEGAYISPDELRKDYARAMPETTFTRVMTEDVKLVAKKEALLALTKTMGISETDIRTLFKRKPGNLAEEVEAIEKALAEKQKTEIFEKASGGLSYQQLASKSLAEMLLSAIKQVKKELGEEKHVDKKAET
jgi:predicted flavoprotein YhiN